MPTARGPTSRQTLQIDWQHVTPPRAEAAGERTTAVQQRHALPVEEALALLAGEDRRPLLVLRECFKCSGTEDALMSSKEDNERTYLLSHWFHCVKLSPDVLEADHPFRNLFAQEAPSHLFLCNRDGSARHDLEGQHSRRELWGTMEGLIEANYAGNHERAVRSLAKILGEMDEADQTLADLSTRYELALSESGDSGKVRKLQSKIGAVRGERDELIAEALEVAALQLKPEQKPEPKPEPSTEPKPQQEAGTK